MLNRVKYLLLVAVFAITSGCSFAPYSANSLPPKLKKIYYQTSNPYAAFELAMKRRLKSCQVIMLAAPTKDALILQVSYSHGYSSDSTASSVQARIYNLNYTATITISDYYGKNLFGPYYASANRSIALQPNEVLEVTPQITTAKYELQQELLNKVFNIISSPKAFLALK